LNQTKVSKDVVTLCLLHKEYKRFCTSEEIVPGLKKYFKQQAIAVLGPIEKKSNGVKNFWRGWRIKPDWSYEDADPLEVDEE
jgi:hypothetical protein